MADPRFLHARVTAAGAAVLGRCAYVAHLLRGHAVTWNAVASDLSFCGGDVVCHACDRVLWCRADDPWRPAAARRRPSSAEADAALFEGLGHLLRLAEQCPRGVSGDRIRRSACEVIEAGSTAERDVRLHRLFHAIGRIEWRRTHGRSRVDDPGTTVMVPLLDALRREVLPMLRDPRL